MLQLPFCRSLVWLLLELRESTRLDDQRQVLPGLQRTSNLPYHHETYADLNPADGDDSHEYARDNNVNNFRSFRFRR